MKKTLLIAVVLLIAGLVQIVFENDASAANDDKRPLGDDIKTPAIVANSYLAEMTEFFGLTPEQQEILPAAVAAQRAAYENLDYSARYRQIREDRAAGQLNDKQYMQSRGALKFERSQILAGTGTLDQILNEKQRADWGAFLQYRNYVPSLRRKGVELSKDQQDAVRKKCKAIADKLDTMNPSDAHYARFSVFRELKEHVEGKVLTKEQRTKLANAAKPK